MARLVRLMETGTLTQRTRVSVVIQPSNRWRDFSQLFGHDRCCTMSLSTCPVTQVENLGGQMISSAIDMGVFQIRN